jgi:hypothetical protein
MTTSELFANGNYIKKIDLITKFKLHDENAVYLQRNTYTNTVNETTLSNLYDKQFLTVKIISQQNRSCKIEVDNTLQIVK